MKGLWTGMKPDLVGLLLLAFFQFGVHVVVYAPLFAIGGVNPIVMSWALLPLGQSLVT